MQTQVNCCRCRKPIPDSADQWPSNSGETVCTECWEAECSERWWEMAKRLENSNV